MPVSKLLIYRDSDHQDYINVLFCLFTEHIKQRKINIQMNRSHVACYINRGTV